MKRANRLPHEQSSPDTDRNDGLPVDGGDVEGHSVGHTKGERFLPGMPGTGGDEISLR
jgi:hypothetical protein